MLNPKLHLTEHFILDEFYKTSYKQLKDVNQHAFESEPLYLVRATKIAFILEQMRTIIGEPITITSSYRCAALNAAVHGVPKSDHMDMCAVDIYINDSEYYNKFMDTISRTYFTNYIRYSEYHPGKHYLHISFNKNHI